MFNNFISIKEIFNMAEETGFIKFKKILIKLFSGKEERIKITWQNCNENKKEWWAIPTVKKRWNYLISGDENIDYNQYVLKKYLSKKDNLKALSFGCGAGQRELKWAETGKFKKIDAFDLSEKRIKYAREQAKKVGLQNITNFETDDVYNIPIREDYYDVVLGEQSLHHFSPLRKIFLIINKFLKADGLFVVNEFVGPNRFQWTDRQIEVTNALLTILPKKYKLKYNNNHINNISYNIDQAVADALADVTINNSCVVSNSSAYNTRINTYAQQIVSDSSKNTSIDCSVVVNTGSLVGSDFIGSVTINCNSKVDITTMNISKKIEFKKSISEIYNPIVGTCKVTITDKYDLDYKQVDVTR